MTRALALTVAAFLLLTASAHAVTRVDVGLYLVDVNFIRSSDETFSVLGIVTATWKDPSRPADWTPRLLFVNAQEITIADRSLVRQPDGSMHLQQKFRGVFNSPFDLRRFPFDRTTLHIYIQPSLSQADTVDFDVNAAATELSPDTLFDAEWDVDTLFGHVNAGDIFPDRKPEPRLDFHMDIDRRNAFYLWSFFFPLCVLVVMSWSLFFTVPPNIQVTMGSMVGLIAYKFAVSYNLPRLSYLSFADAYFLFCLVMIASSHAANTRVIWMTEHEELDRRDRLRYRCMRLFPLGFITGVTVLAVLFLGM